MNINLIKGNIFTSKQQVLVNTVNCVGVMGAGIALEYRFRYPKMFQRYVELCDQGQIQIGKLWIYRDDRWVLNFPTKKHWKHPSKLEYLAAGLEKFVASYREQKIKSIAFPLLGADKGGLDPQDSLQIMRDYLTQVDIPVEIYTYDPNAQDDLYEKTKAWLLPKSTREIADLSGIAPQYVDKIKAGLERPEIKQLGQLARVKGIGIKSLERIFAVSMAQKKEAEGEGEGQLKFF